MTGRAESWVVLASWSNSGQTIHGPWPDHEPAAQWSVCLERDPACTWYTVELVQPPTA